MSESILKALMQLFAIIASVDKDGVSVPARKVVKEYLEQHLNQELVKEYLGLFDHYIGIHHRDIVGKDGTKVKKRTSANSVKVLMICRQINEELQQKQKVLVLLQLLEFINEDDKVTEQELDFVKTVADVFNIQQNEYENIKAFILNSIDEIPEKEQLLIIESIETSIETEIKYRQDPNLEGEIIVLHIASTNMYVFRYTGNDDLYLNGQNILPNRYYLLDQGASIRSPKINPIYYGDIAGEFLQDAEKSRIFFSANKVEFRFRNSENGIQQFTFHGESGQLVGIMGGSGVGKSTLLNVMNGNLIPQSGDILINGYDIHKGKDELKGIVGFVPQDDLLIEELSVWQNLYYNAQLCFKKMSKQDITERVKNLLLDLDLYEIRDLKVGSPLNKFISGGQRKRLNIALELIREPYVLFVDEPTSGLSSADSEMVMDLLKEQTLKNKLVIINIHQPSSDIFKLFDKLLVLDKGGYLIYNGNPIDAIVYFKRMSHHVNADESQCMNCGNVNPEQILQIIESKVVNEYGKLTHKRKISPKEWHNYYVENIESKQITMKGFKEKMPDNPFNIPGKLKQFKIFSIRNVLSKLANRQYMLINFLEAPVLAIILGYFTKFIIGEQGAPFKYIFSENENIPAYLFMAVVVALFLGLTVSAEEIIRDRKILKREKFLNLSRLSYINSKILILFLISAIQTISFILVGNYILEIKGMTMSYWLVLFTTSACANMIGLNISAALDSVVTIYILIPLILVPQLLLSGVIVKFDKLHKNVASPNHVPFSGDLMTSRWAYEALAVTQFKDNKFQKHFFSEEQAKSQAGFITNYLVPELENRLQICKQYIQDEEQKDALKHELQVIKNEIIKLDRRNKIIKAGFTNNLQPQTFSPKVIKQTDAFLDQVRKFYSQKYSEASQLLDKEIEKTIKKYNGKDRLAEIRQNYHNDHLGNLVLNKQEIHKIIEYDNHLIQIAEPIYKIPQSKNGRAHFFAPVKRLGAVYIDTLWFNVMVIWFTSLLLYIILVFDLLRKSIEFFGRLKIKNLFKSRKK